MNEILRLLIAPLTVTLLGSVFSAAQTAAPKTFSEAVQQVMAQPQYRHVTFGIEIYSLDEQRALFTLNAQKLFTPGSTTKLLTEGTALQLLGPDFRFHTSVYRTGEVDKNGTLRGDLVLVASGDPNLSNRLQSDGTLAFADEDHSYGGPESKLISGDPLLVLHEFAMQIAKAGIKHVDGKVVVDASLFPEGERELGTGVVISPISVNDNVIDVTIQPATQAGKPAVLAESVTVPYLHFDNRITTVQTSASSLEAPETVDNPDGTQTVILKGSVSLTDHSSIYGYPVSSPSRFAAVALTQALQNAGVTIAGKPEGITSASPYKSFYQAQYKVGEHISAPLSEEVKVTLKVSQNLHASMTPFFLGAIVGKATEEIDRKGFLLERDFLMKAGLDLTGASQSDGAGGASAAFYTPDFMVHYLAYMAKQPSYTAYEHALPILGRDGTLVHIQSTSPAAGHVFAKTGTFASEDLLNGHLMLEGKGLAGYTTTPAGQHLAFALYLNHLETGDDKTLTQISGEALGAIAAAAYALPIDKPTVLEVP